MKKALLTIFLAVALPLCTQALTIPQGKLYFDNSKTQYTNVKFVYGSNTREECYVLQMTNEGDNLWSVSIASEVADMYRYTFAATSLADGNQGKNFNTIKDYISNTLGEYRTATSDATILSGGVFVPTSGNNWAAGAWKTLSSFRGKPYSGTLPVLYINTTKTIDLPACCTVVADRYYAYFENSEGWAEVGCYTWNSGGQIAGGWPGETCEKVGYADNGNEIWRWVCTKEKTADNLPANIIFNNNENVSGIQTGDLLFTNGGYYTYTTQWNVGPDVVLTADGKSEEVVPITSKEEYVDGTYYIDALGLSGYSNLGSKDAPLVTKIKGRGNYTWTGFDKKPYRLKFDKKASPLGMKKSKHFTLLAHADDDLGFLRNTVGFQLSRLLGMPYTPEQQPVEVMLNGEYIGLYMLTDKLRVDENRVNIVEQADNETDATKITGGWFLEIDNYEEDGQIRFTEGNGAAIRFTYHTPEILSSAQETYITNLLKDTDSAIYSANKNSTTWENYIDMDLLARFYIIQEVMDNAESFHGSCYLYKELGDDTKFCFGPVWDFGNSFHRGFNKFIYVDPPFGQNWIGEIAKYPRFQAKVKEIWQPFFGTSYPTLDSFIDDFVDQISQAAVCDAERWPSYGNSNIASRKSEFKSRIRQKTEYLRQQWGNGTTGINEEIGTKNDELNTPVYTLSGQKLSNSSLHTPHSSLPKGIYIVGGKKVVVK